MTREEAIAVLEAIRQYIIAHYLFTLTEEDNEAIDMAISALSAEPKAIANNCDLISRADAIEAVRKELVCDGRHETHDKTCRFIADVLLSALPSAERVGVWIPKEDYGGFDYYQCSNCKEDFYFEAEPSKNEYHYCPNCGARMKGDEE